MNKNHQIINNQYFNVFHIDIFIIFASLFIYNETSMKSEILKHFEDMEDPRVVGRTIHPLRNIVFITVVGALCGLTGWEEIADFAKYRKGFFSRYLDISMGLPCEDTLRRFFEKLKPKVFGERFQRWASSLVGSTQDKSVSIDGKCIRAASKMSPDNPVHIVSAWVGENAMTLAQVKVSDKSNEITAIPELIDILELRGALVSIDAMGCQTDIAEKIKLAKADYVLAVKQNQPTLWDDTVRSFEVMPACGVEQTTEGGHGRVEERTYTFCDDLSCLLNAGSWEGLAMLVRVDSRVTDKKTGETTQCTRHFITSCRDMKRVAGGIRSHWGVESMHWTLDVTFGEDADTKREGNSAENFNIIRKMALNVLKNDGVDYGKKRVSLKRRMLKAANDDQYLKQLIGLI